MTTNRISFYVRDEKGLQSGLSALILTSPAQARAKCRELPAGRYTIRDCLGGLRMRIAVQSGEVQILETTR